MTNFLIWFIKRRPKFYAILQMKQYKLVCASPASQKVLPTLLCGQITPITLRDYALNIQHPLPIWLSGKIYYTQ